MKQLAQKSNQIVAIRDAKQTISDAYLKLALRMVKQQRTIEQLKRNCGIR